MNGLVPYDSNDGTSDETGSDSDTDGSCARKRPKVEDNKIAAEQQHRAIGTWSPPALQPGMTAGGMGQRHSQSRVRTFPHVEGVYPTLVMVPVQLSTEEQAALARVLAAMQQLLPDLQPMSEQLRVAAPGQQAAQVADAVRSICQGASSTTSLHLSLSRVLPVPFRLLEELEGQLRDALAGTAGAELTAQGLTSLVNDEGTRSFLALPLTKGRAEVCALIRHVDQALALHQLPTYYQDPQPHISIAWLLGSRQAELQAAIRQLSMTDPPLPQHDVLDAAATATEECGRQEEPNLVSGRAAPWCGRPVPGLSFGLRRVVCRAGIKEHVLWSAG
ncbi:hypothetical protein V8C86DRAFT_2484777 [Haematococcus lacustris]